MDVFQEPVRFYLGHSFPEKKIFFLLKMKLINIHRYCIYNLFVNYELKHCLGVITQHPVFCNQIVW